MQVARHSLIAAGCALILLDGACSSKTGNGGARSDSSANAMAGPGAHDSASANSAMPAIGEGHTSSATTAPSTDQQFLRIMSDHHKGLIALAHETIERKELLAVKGEAKSLDSKQDAELDQMMTMLEQHYHDAYAPKMTSDNRAMLESLKSKTGVAYDRTFRQDVIRHHQDGIAMIDQYVPKLTDPALKSMAGKMKAEQEQDIALLQKQLGTRE